MNLSGRFWTFVGTGVLLVLLAGVVFVGLLTAAQARSYNRQLAERLLAEAHLLAVSLPNVWGAEDRRLAAEIAELEAEGTLVVVFSADGVVHARSRTVPRELPELFEQQEVQSALVNGQSRALRRCGPEDVWYQVAALRVGREAGNLGVIWLARPAWTLTGPGRDAAWLIVGFALTSLVAAVIAILLALRLRRWLLYQLIRTARALSAEQLTGGPPDAARDRSLLLTTPFVEMRRRLHAQLAVIEQQRQMLAAVIDRLDEGVVVAGADGRILLINRAACELLQIPTGGGRQPADCRGQPVERLIRQHDLQQMLRTETRPPTDRRGPDEPIQQTQVTLDTDQGRAYLLARATTLELPWPERESAAGPQARAGPSRAARLLTLSDISEMERALQVRTDFVANASHELRTPLSAIRAAVETLLGMELAGDGPAARRFLQTIDRHSERLEALVGDLLDLSRLESLAAGFELQTLPVARVLEDLHARFAHALEAGRLEWVSEPAAAGASIVVDPHLLRLILDNLVDNAVKFTSPGGRVSVRCRPKDGGIEFEVADNGCGIPPAEQERVFERFYQIERARSGAERGTGLGLAIVRHAVRALGGGVRLESTPGEGTRVFVWLPQPPPATPQRRR